MFILFNVKHFVFQIVDEGGNEVGRNVEGEIWIRGPQLCKGYLNLPEENMNFFTEDGWAKTGQYELFLN